MPKLAEPDFSEYSAIGNRDVNRSFSHPLVWKLSAGPMVGTPTCRTWSPSRRWVDPTHPCMGTTYGCAFLRNDETLHIYTLVGGLEHEWIMTFHLLGISSSQPTNF